MTGGEIAASTQSLLVPVKAFGEAKERLAPLLDALQRSELARRLATGVVLAASPLDVAVVCDDEDVAIWAEGLGALVIWAPGKGLDVAVAHGVEVLEGEGYSWITVSHADLPYPDRLNRLPEFDGITIVPDRRDDGSNVIKIPSGSGFRFSYGKGSFSRHLEEATRVRRPVSVLRDAQLSIDIDDPEDMSFFDDQTRQWGPEGPH